jgi:hypothetical protein
MVFEENEWHHSKMFASVAGLQKWRKLNSTAAPGTYCSEGQQLTQTIWQLWAAKMKRCCGKTTDHSGRAWRRLLPEAAAIVISSQATVLEPTLKPFYGLRILKY